MTDDSAMEEERLEEIRARCEAATKGPWEWIDPEDDSPWNPRSYRASLRTVNHSDRVEIGSGRYLDLPVFILEAEDLDASDPQALINAEFLRHARTDVPDLLTEVRRLREENEALKQQLQPIGEIAMQVFDIIVVDNPQRPDISIGDPDDLPGRCSIHYRGDKIKALQLLRDALTAFEKYVGQ